MNIKGETKCKNCIDKVYLIINLDIFIDMFLDLIECDTYFKKNDKNFHKY